MKILKIFTTNLKTICSSKFYSMFSSTKQNQFNMIINDMIKKVLFKINYNKKVIFIQINSMLKKNNKQRDASSFIYCIFSKKVRHFLRLNFEINSIFDIFQIFDDEIITMGKNKHFQSLIIDLFKSENK